MDYICNMKRSIGLNRLYLVALIVFFTIPRLDAQVREMKLEVGKYIELQTCKGEGHYSTIDLLVKTRWPIENITYDSLRGAGFYDWYFNGDIDSGRLLCGYENVLIKISAIQRYLNEDGSDRIVLLCLLDEKTRVLWIEAKQALDKGEILLID